MFKKSGSITLLCLAFLACKNDPKTQEAKQAPKTVATAPVPPDGSATFIINEGIVNWSSAYVTGNRAHEGTIRVKRGELWVNEGQVLSGSITMDMNSIGVTDLKDPRSQLDLEMHLKNEDFFESNVYPEAEFLFTQVSNGALPDYNRVLTGDLTMKGIAAPVSIPFKTSIEGDMLRAESPVVSINRTSWGVNYRSGLLGTTKDKMIQDEVLIRLNLVAKKK